MELERPKSAWLSLHAKERLNERTQLTIDQVCRILDYQYVVVGNEPKTNRLHKLFYSIPDETHFVAVQDMANCEVITILPLDYHENLAWEIPASKLKRAKHEVGAFNLEKLKKEPAEPARVPGYRMNLTAKLKRDQAPLESLDEENCEGHSKSYGKSGRSLGSYRFEKFPQNAKDILENTEFIQILIGKIKERTIPFETIEEVVINNGSILIRINIQNVIADLDEAA